MTLSKRLFAALKTKYQICNEVYQSRLETRNSRRAAFRRMERICAAEHYLNRRSIRDGQGRIASF